MDKYYWQGKKSFPEESGELTYTPVTFDSKAQTITVDQTYNSGADKIEEYLIEGFDEMWLVTQHLKGILNPVKLTDLAPMDAATHSYTLTDDKILSKVRRFAKNLEEAAVMRKLCKRTVY